jgi:predicted dehydrogenase
MKNDQFKNISWGIIGCGDVTEIKSGPAFNTIEGSTLAAVMRRDRAKAEDYARRHAVPQWYDDADALMNDPKINAVYIATPPAFHMEYAIRALQKNLFVYVEKPVALHSSEALKIAKAVNHCSGKLCVAHYRRTLPSYIFVKKMLKSTIIGDIRLVRITMLQPTKPSLVVQSKEHWRLDPKISGGGYFHDLAPHQLDLMYHFFGTPVWSSGFSLNQSKQYAADDMVSGQMVFKNNIAFSGNWNFSVAEKESTDECVIIGTKGSIRFSFFENNVIVKDEFGKETIRHFENPKHAQQPMIESVVRYFRGEIENPCSIDEAVEVMRMMDSFTTKR